MPFHHAYNFIPCPIRPTKGPLADQAPAGHDQLRADLWSGRIHVALTTTTDLIVADQQDNRPVHTGRGLQVRSRTGNPAGAINGQDIELQQTSVKGMLRAGYEAATNSRFGVSAARADDRPGYRGPTRDAARLRPVLLVQQEGTWKAQPCSTAHLPSPAPHGEPHSRHGHLQARDITGELTRTALAYHLKRFATFGDAAHVEVLLRKVRNQKHNYTYNLVVDIRATERRTDGGAGSVPELTERLSPTDHSHHALLADASWSETGVVVRTGMGFKKKHDERVFINAGPLLDLAPGALVDYELLLDSYVAALCGQSNFAEAWDLVNEATRRRFARWANRPTPLLAAGAEKMSAVIRRRLADGERLGLDLTDPTPAWAVVQGNMAVSLQPAMVSRRLSAASTLDLLRPDLRPATRLDHFSPACRVFGQVEQVEQQEDGQARRQGAAYRGQLTVSAVRPVRAELTAPLLDPWLPEQGAPKPANARLYGACDQIGTPYPATTARGAMYQDGHGVRGRKTFPSHGPGGLRPYRQEPAQNDQRRASQVLSAVAPGSVFAFDIDVINLSDVELGALMWLLTPTELAIKDSTGRPQWALGRGRAFGFGGCVLEITSHDLRRGATWAGVYRDLTGCLGNAGAGEAAADLVGDFKRACEDAADGIAFDRLPHITALRRSASGYDDNYPIRYPTQPGNNPREVLAWFVNNEDPKAQRKGLPPPQALPPLTDDRNPADHGNPSKPLQP